MKSRRSKLFVGLFISFFSLITWTPSLLPDVSSQEGLAEAEPNDSRERAQLINLVQGGKTVIQGSAAQGDGGSIVSELPSIENLLFAKIWPGDPMEDWFAIEVNKSVELAIELDWVNEASDLDIWTFAEISPAVFPDGNATHHLAASNGQPELEPTGEENEPGEYRILYAYSDRQAEVENKQLAVPETSRYYLAVSIFDFPGFRTPPTDYTLTLGTPARGSTRRVIHDTGGPGLYAYIFPSEVATGRVLALQRITPPEYPARLDVVDILQFRLGGRSQVGTTLDLIVMLDPQGTGDPLNATQVLRRTVRIQDVNAFNGYQVGDAKIIAQSGDIYVGFEIIDQLPRDDLHMPFDIDKVGYGRTFVSTDRGRTFGKLYTTSPQVGFSFEANVGIDAYLTINPGAQAKAPLESQAVRVRKTTDRPTRDGIRIAFVKQYSRK